MTQQEALKELENLTIDYGKRTEKEIERLDEAVDMAIAALNHTAELSKKVKRGEEMDKLKPCPFFGKYSQTVVDDETKEKFGVKDILQKAIEAWNKVFC